MKKWVCLALAVITGVSLIGCSNSPESTSGTVTAAPSAGVEGGDKAAAGYELPIPRRLPEMVRQIKAETQDKRTGAASCASR